MNFDTQKCKSRKLMLVDAEANREKLDNKIILFLLFYLHESTQEKKIKNLGALVAIDEGIAIAGR